MTDELTDRQSNDSKAGYDPADAFPPRLRTWCYATGAILCLGVAPALAALGRPEVGVAVASLGGAANALAFGYRPTRNHNA